MLIGSNFAHYVIRMDNGGMGRWKHFGAEFHPRNFTCRWMVHQFSNTIVLKNNNDFVWKKIATFFKRRVSTII